MSSKPILSVVRISHITVTDELFRASQYDSDWRKSIVPDEAERYRQFCEYINNHNSQAGFYIKSGGGEPTPDMQQAQIFGWSRSAKENLKGYVAPYYEVIPVLIEVAK